MRRGGRTTGAVASALLLAGMTSGCGSDPEFPDTARITVDRPEALFDQPVRLKIDDLRPWAKVTVSATTEGEQSPWRSEAVFRANGMGTVDLAKDEPLKGSYGQKADAMGLFWSMRATAEDGPEHFRLGRPEDAPSYQVRVTVSRDGRQLDHRDLTRVGMAEGVRHRALTVDEDGVRGSLYLPPEGAPKAAPVLLFGGSGGGDELYGKAALLASHGHPALSLCYWLCPGRPDKLEEIELEYFVRAAELLAGQTQSHASRMMVAGRSRGSEAAQLLGQHYPETFQDVVAIASSNMVNRAFPDPGDAWTQNGEPIPEWSISLDEVRGTVLGIAGGDDQLWPAKDLSEPIAEEHRLLVYPKAGHSVGGPPYLPADPTKSRHPVTGERYDFGGTRAANAAAKADSWPEVLRLLRD